MAELILGDCIEKLNELEENSIDTCITDPPYHLTSIVERFGKKGSAPAKGGVYERSSKGFMGKVWDGGDIAFDPTTWEAVYRVLKPGALLLAFGGTRTYHRLACAIEDAGFVIVDQIGWVYGCLSEDSEVLTDSGFKRFHKITKYDKIKVYDTENNVYKWEKPKGWCIYKVEQDTAYRIKSDKTDQIVSRNHNCLVERDGKLVFKRAEDLLQVERVPYLSYNFHFLQERLGEILFLQLLRKSKRLVKAILSKRQGEKETWKRVERRQEPRVERWGYLQKTKREICRSINKICAMSKRVFINGSQRRLCYGTQTISGTANSATADKTGGGSSYQSRRNGQSDRQFDVIQYQHRAQEIRMGGRYRTTVATIEPITYSGKIFCPTVSTGAFVARRNGKVFITGNSGFPKSHNIGKAIDKHLGKEPKIVSQRTDGRYAYSFQETNNQMGQLNPRKSNVDKIGQVTEGATSEARLWDGWGTALKPAHEPICVAMKPRDGTYANNALKWGVAGYWIDGGRIIHDEPCKTMKAQTDVDVMTGGGKYGQAGRRVDTLELKPSGRWPANLIHDGSDEVLEMFPQSPGALAPVAKGQKGFGGEIYNKFKTSGDDGATFYNDSGSAARFFYCAKASKSERNAGLDGVEPKWIDNSRKEGSAGGNNPRNRGARAEVNHHPTIKPIALMEYLVRLTKTPTGGIVLDPFMGSGTTGIACVNEGRGFIGIEMEPEYFEIAQKRIEHAKKGQMKLL